jgi:CBS domain-containing protein
MLRPYFFGLDSMPMMQHLPQHAFVPSWSLLLSTVVVGLSVGVLSLLLTAAIYAAEDTFHRLPIHWMWWPAIGGLVVGIGGYFEPRALGVGYDVVLEILQGKMLLGVMLGLMVAKAVMWAIALGSGTSGGVFAPFLIVGGILGAIEAHYLPGGDVQLCALIGMGAVLSGTMRAPLTGAIFALEFTYDTGALVPLVLGSILSYGFTVLTMKRSILTEKVARRGLHVSQEYGVDPLERLSVAQVMSGDVVTIPAAMPIQQLVKQFFLGPKSKQHQGYPVVATDGSLLGVITKTDLLDEWAEGLSPESSGEGKRVAPIIAYDMMSSPPITAFPQETCREAVERMVQTGIGRLVVVDAADPTRILGMATRSDVLKSRARLVDEEQSRERFYSARSGSRRRGTPKTDPPRKTA